MSVCYNSATAQLCTVMGLCYLCLYCLTSWVPGWAVVNALASQQCGPRCGHEGWLGKISGCYSGFSPLYDPRDTSTAASVPVVQSL